MKKSSFIYKIFLIITVLSFSNKLALSQQKPIQLITLDPGHFHAALIQKTMYPEIDPMVHVYANSGNDLNAHLALVNKYNSRSENPTSWQEKTYAAPDFFNKMIQEKKGNVVVIAGNNRFKTAYISKSVANGFNVLADKPMAIDPSGFKQLRQAFSEAKNKQLILFDIMTERYEITNILQKNLMHFPDIFGTLQQGTTENPAIQKISVHHFFKNVSGAPLIRPSWFFDVDQLGNGIVDVTTHLVDLVQWECFPNQVLDYQKDIKMLSARRWSTSISPEEFKKSTQLEKFPDFLLKDVRDDSLHVYANGEMNYALKNIHVKVSVQWNFQAPPGTGDTHYSIVRGTKANIIIRQGAAQNYQPVVYIEPLEKNKEFEAALKKGINTICATYPGIKIEEDGKGWKLSIPDKYAEGHEAFFGKVVEKYISYLKTKKLPEWEEKAMLCKYYTTTSALGKALAMKPH